MIETFESSYQIWCRPRLGLGSCSLFWLDLVLPKPGESRHAPALIPAKGSVEMGPVPVTPVIPVRHLHFKSRQLQFLSFIFFSSLFPHLKKCRLSLVLSLALHQRISVVQLRSRRGRPFLLVPRIPFLVSHLTLFTLPPAPTVYLGFFNIPFRGSLL